MVRDRAIRVLIVDAHRLFREGVRRLLKGAGGFEVVGEADTHAEAMSAVLRESPDVVLFEPGVEALSALTLCGEVRRRAPGVRVMLVTGVTSSRLHREAVQMGACGVVPKHLPAETLFKAIRKVHEGEVWLDRRLVAQLISDHQGAGDPEQARIRTLTRREREVVALVSQGLKNKQIAERLSVSDITVRHHLTSIFAKLEVQDRLSLVVYAFGHGLAAPATTRHQCA